MKPRHRQLKIVMRGRFMSFHEQHLYEVGFEDSDDDDYLNQMRNSTVCALWPRPKFILQIGRAVTNDRQYFPNVGISQSEDKPSKGKVNIEKMSRRKAKLGYSSSSQVAADVNNNEIVNEQKPVMSSSQPLPTVIESSNNFFRTAMIEPQINQMQLPILNMQQPKSIEPVQQPIPIVSSNNQVQEGMKIPHILPQVQIINQQEQNSSQDIYYDSNNAPEEDTTDSDFENKDDRMINLPNSNFTYSPNTQFNPENPSSKRKKRSNFTPQQRTLLDKFFFDHIDHPYAEKYDLELLEKQTNLSKKQIQVFMTNARMRKFNKKCQNKPAKKNRDFIQNAFKKLNTNNSNPQIVFLQSPDELNNPTISFTPNITQQ